MTSLSLVRRLTALCAVGLTCLAATGCSSQKKSLDREQSGLKKLVIFYGQYLSKHRGQPPTNEAEFKKFVQSLLPPDAKPSGGDDLDRIFISGRDGKPYVVIYGQPKGPPGLAGAPVIAYEQEGKGGKRWVASSLGAIEEVDEARFRKLVPAAGQ
jgi:hypothetical protein